MAFLLQINVISLQAVPVALVITCRRSLRWASVPERSIQSKAATAVSLDLSLLLSHVVLVHWHA